MIASRLRAWTRPRPQTRTLTVLARVAEGRAEELRATLREMDAGESPFATVPGVHFARLLVLADVVRQRRATGLRPLAKLFDALVHGPRGEQRPDPLPDPYLLFTATMDVLSPDEPDGYPRALRALGPAADRIWGLCAGYPGHRDAEAFTRFLRDRSLPADYVFSAFDTGPVDDIKRALRLRERLGDLAASTQDQDDDELRRRFRTAFPDPTAHLPRAYPTGPTGPTCPTCPTGPGGVDGRARSGGRRSAVDGSAEDLELSDIQGTVLDRHPHLLASTHLFLRVVRPLAAARWLAAATDRVTCVHSGPERPDRTLTIGLSHAGLGALGVPDGDLAAFPTEFRQGMYRREGQLAPAHGTLTWQEPFSRADAVHAVLLLAARDRRDLDAWTAHIRHELRDGFQILTEQHGDRISAEPVHGVRRFMEHFGFVDGLSRPGVAGHDEGTNGEILPPGEFVLGYHDVDGDVSGAGLPARFARNGSFLVYRKLEQDVPAFRRLTADLAHRFGDADTAAAKLVGRWPDGTPLCLSPESPRPDLAADSRFGFAGDPDGTGCPLGAHVRRANPRDALPTGSRLTRRHHMLRRGIPYGRYLAEDGDPRPADGRGLLFLAVVGDLGRQFEFVQTEWMNDGNVFGLGRQSDVLASAGGATARMTVQGRPPSFVPLPRPLVTCRGGEYFFLPSLTALRALP